jgi:integrase/recombinase XerC
MGRAAKARYWPDRDVWFTRVGGKYHVLARGKRSRAEAVNALRELLVEGRKDTKPGVTVAELCDRLLVWVRENRSALTLEWYKRHLRAFGKHIGRQTDASTLRPFHVTDWLDSTAWKQSTRHGAITAVKRAFRWGYRQGLLDSNSMEGLDRPGIKRREAVLSPEVEIIVLEKAVQPLRQFLEFLHETGCRPSEATRLCIDHVDLESGVAVLFGKTTSRTGRQRQIFLTPRAQELVNQAVHRVEQSETVFVNSRGRPWTRHALAHAMGRLRKKLELGPECTAESFRHGWITEAKLRLPNSVVAELAGHSSTTMIDKHYSHLNQRQPELSAAVILVRKSGTGTPMASPASADPTPAPDQPPATAPQKPRDPRP